MAAPRTLAEWVVALIDTLDAGDPVAGLRMRQVTGPRRAVVGLDRERVEVSFGPEGIRAEPHPTGRPLDGSGTTDRATVRDLLAGRLEASHAVLDGLVDLHGSADACCAVLQAIEILLDAATRLPALQLLAAELVGEPGPAPGPPGATTVSRPGTAWYPGARPGSEDALLAELGLLPDDGAASPR